MSDYLLRGKPDVSGLPRISVGKLIYNKLKEFGTRVSLVDVESEEILTYAEILDKSVKLADALQRLGLEQNDVISQVSENNINYFIPYLSCLYYGYVCNLINPDSTNYEMEHYLDQTKPKFVFCSKSVLPKILEIRRVRSFIEIVVVTDGPADQGNYSMHQLIKEQPENVNFEPIDCDIEEQIALILYSSGTTGLPKAVALTHKNIRFSIMHTGPNYLGTTDRDTYFFTLPFYHAVAMSIIGCCFVYGAKTILLSKFEPHLLLSTIQKYKCTFTVFVPPIVTFFSQSPLLAKYNMTSLERIFCGSAPVSPSIVKTFLKRMPNTRILNIYGATETSCVITYSPLDRSNFDNVGTISSNYEAKFVNIETRKPVGPTDLGELCLRGDCIFKGYYNNEQATKDAFDEEGFFKTGDVGYFDDHHCLHIVDRIKDMIKYNAYQVSPVEIETVLRLHRAVKDAAVIGIPNKRSGELPLAFVVKKKGVTENELVKFVAGHLSSYKQLHGGVQFVKEIPRKTLDKIDKKKLKEIWRDMQQEEYI